MSAGHNLGPVDQIPFGEGRAFGVDGEQVAEVAAGVAGEHRARLLGVQRVVVAREAKKHLKSRRGS